MFEFFQYNNLIRNNLNSIKISKLYELAFNTVDNSRLVLLVTIGIYHISYRVYKTIGPSLAASCEDFLHWQTVVNLINSFLKVLLWQMLIRYFFIFVVGPLVILVGCIMSMSIVGVLRISNLETIRSTETFRDWSLDTQDQNSARVQKACLLKVALIPLIIYKV